jgi:hypothetical protein
MTHNEWTEVLAPKVSGSYNLHAALPTDLDFFVLLSSASGIIGSGGQANYAAANTYQDALAAYRIARGQKAVSLDLGLMTEEGYFTDYQQKLEQYINIKKLLPISQAQLFAVLEYHCDPKLRIEDVQSQIVMGLSLPEDGLASWMEQPMFSPLHLMSARAAGTSANASSEETNSADLSTVATAPSLTEASAIVSRSIHDKLSRILSRAPDEIDPEKPIHAHGVDSLVAVELRNWFLKSMKVDVPVFEILGGGTVTALGASLAGKIWTRAT